MGTLTAYSLLSHMSRHRKTRPLAPFPRYLMTTYWFTKVTPRSLARFKLVVSLHIHMQTGLSIHLHLALAHCHPSINLLVLTLPLRFTCNPLTALLELPGHGQAMVQIEAALLISRQLKVYAISCLCLTACMPLQGQGSWGHIHQSSSSLLKLSMLMKVPERSGSPLLCHAKEGVLSGPPDGIVLPALQEVVAELTNPNTLSLISRAWHGALSSPVWHAAYAHFRRCSMSLKGKVRQSFNGAKRDKAARTAASGKQEGLATWLAGPLPSDSAVLEVVSLPSSEKRSQSDESSSPVMKVDAPSWVNSVAPPADAADPAHACVVCQAPSSIS